MTGAQGRRLTADAYCGTALEILGTEGKDGLTIGALCQRLQVTKGSFYHHFTDLAHFERQLLAFWEREHSERIFRQLSSIEDTVQRVDSMIDFAESLPHHTEAAIRAWARGDAAVAEVVERVDEMRTRFVVDTLVEMRMAREQAVVMTRLGLDTVIGEQMRSRTVDLAGMRRSLEELQVLLARTLPD